MATGSKTVTSLGLSCPFCGEAEPALNLDLNNLESIHCSNCDHEFSPAEAIEHLTNQRILWRKVQKWIEAAPRLTPE